MNGMDKYKELNINSNYINYFCLYKHSMGKKILKN